MQMSNWPFLRLSSQKLLLHPLALFVLWKRLPGKIKFGLIFIQIGFFFLQQLENEVIIFFSGIFLKNIKFMVLEAIPRIKTFCYLFVLVWTFFSWQKKFRNTQHHPFQ